MPPRDSEKNGRLEKSRRGSHFQGSRLKQLKDWSATESVPSHDPPAAGWKHDVSSRRNPRAMAGCRNSPLGKAVMSQEATAMMRKRAMRSGNGCDAAPQHTGTRSAPAGVGNAVDRMSSSGRSRSRNAKAGVRQGKKRDGSRTACVNVESPSGVLGSILADRRGTDAPLYVCRRTNPAGGSISNRIASGRFNRVPLCYTSF